jgi:hypothetical protein
MSTPTTIGRPVGGKLHERIGVHSTLPMQHSGVITLHDKREDLLAASGQADALRPDLLLENLDVAERLCLAGVIHQWGRPAEVLDEPRIQDAFDPSTSPTLHISMYRRTSAFIRSAFSVLLC